MKPVFQTRFGWDGNCWPAVLASILEVPLEEVDYCACSDHPAWINRTQRYLATKGLFYVEVDWSDNKPPSFTVPPEGALVILGCTTERKFPHVVIGKTRHLEFYPDGQVLRFQFDLVHDPFPEGSSGMAVDKVFFLCKLNV